MNFKNKLIILCLIISISLIGCSSSQKDVSKNTEDNSTKTKVSQNSNQNASDESKIEENENTEVEDNEVAIKEDREALKSSNKEDQKKNTTLSNKLEQSTSQPKTTTNNNLNNTTTTSDNTTIKNETTQSPTPKTEENVKQPSTETKKPQEIKYKGSGMGYEGSIYVEVTVTEGKITNISVLSHEDTPSVALRAFDLLTTSIVTSQKLDIDAVSGATYSSKGFIEAVKSALGK